MKKFSSLIFLMGLSLTSFSYAFDDNGFGMTAEPNPEMHRPALNFPIKGVIYKHPDVYKRRGAAEQDPGIVVERGYYEPVTNVTIDDSNPYNMWVELETKSHYPIRIQYQFAADIAKVKEQQKNPAQNKPSVIDLTGCKKLSGDCGPKDKEHGDWSLWAKLAFQCYTFDPIKSLDPSVIAKDYEEVLLSEQPIRRQVKRCPSSDDDDRPIPGARDMF